MCFHLLHVCARGCVLVFPPLPILTTFLSPTPNLPLEQLARIIIPADAPVYFIDLNKKKARSLDSSPEDAIAVCILKQRLHYVRVNQ